MDQQRQQQQQRPRQHQHHHQQHAQVPWIKLLLIGSLGGLALFLQVTIWTLEMYVEETRQAVADAAVQRNKEDDTDNMDSTTNNNQKVFKDTVRSTRPVQRTELHGLFRAHSNSGSSSSDAATATAYWNQAVQLLDWWDDDPVLNSFSDAGSGSFNVGTTPKNATLGLAYLQRAAAAGHPTAQLVVANALAAGFWPWSSTSSASSGDDDDVLSFLLANNNDEQLQLWNNLRVQEGWIQDASAMSSSSSLETTSSTGKKKQQNRQQEQLNQAWLLWHMSAMAGNVEAAMTLSSRLEFAAKQQQQQQAAASGNTNAPSTCEKRLPYTAAAAHGILDLLAADPASRARILPAKDKHVLYQVHLHGGTGSRLDAENRPDENPDALQYYHVRAVDTSAAADPAEAARAAYTLARYYHYGLRGAPQNLTLALQYYEMAAAGKHWEAAGAAGLMRVWGIGTPKRDAFAAHKLFLVGTLNGQVESCRARFHRKVKLPKNQQAEFSLCESSCLTGMGLLHLVGVPMLAKVDTDLATRYLQLAKDQGDVDAAYYLAMMKLGWHTHMRQADHAGSNRLKMASTGIAGRRRRGDDHILRAAAAAAGNNNNNNGGASSSTYHPTAAEYQTILSDLTTAASKGHLMALHRLGTMYETGIWITNGGNAKTASSTTTLQVVPRDCEKAVKHYNTIINLASPQRAKRLRRAYKQYMAGDTTGSLRNYLAAAEAGSDLGMLNAAFLLEQGDCLGLSNPKDCAAASVRLWKAAAQKGGHAEASLRVGDFYYYGRLRDDNDDDASLASSRQQLRYVPFGWTRGLFFPETVVMELWNKAWNVLFSSKPQESPSSSSNEQAAGRSLAKEGGSGAVCVGNEKDGTCAAWAEETSPKDEHQHTVEKDLASAAHYYHLAAEKNSSPRAHFNLGFLYEWGLGLKQDFPLAKRHYDLAISTGPQEAEVPVTLALIALSAHEYLVKKWLSWQDWLDEEEHDDEGELEDDDSATKEDDSSDDDDDEEERQQQQLGGDSASRRTEKSIRRKRMEVMIRHLLSGESFVILVLTIALWVLLQIRHYRTRR